VSLCLCGEKIEASSQYQSFRIEPIMREEEIFALMTSFVGCSFVLIILALVVIVWWRIFAKTGYGGPFGLLMLIPLVNLVMMFVLAFAKWPIEKELEELRRQQYR